jgi:hypothetical protein
MNGGRPEGAAPGWGKTRDATPRSAWPGRIMAEPVRSYEPRVNEMSPADGESRSLAGFMHAAGLCGSGMRFRGPGETRISPRLCVRHSGWERRASLRVPLSGVAEGRCMVLPLGGLLDWWASGIRAFGTAQRLLPSLVSVARRFGIRKCSSAAFEAPALPWGTHCGANPGTPDYRRRALATGSPRRAAPPAPGTRRRPRRGQYRAIPGQRKALGSR